MSDQEQDLDRVRRVRAGDSRALAELYDRHTPLLYSVAARVLGDAADAEDVVQQTWVQAWTRADAYDPSRGSVAAWLVTVARSRAIDRLRARATRRKAEDAPELREPAPAQSPEAPAAVAAERELHERVTAALSTLRAEQRQVLELAYFGGLSQTEIAERLGAPLGTVKSWARQGLARLREIVRPEMVT